MPKLPHLLLCFFLCLTACQKAEVPVYFDPLVHDWPHDLSDIAPDPNVHYGKLDNGLRYALRQNAKPENEAALRFWIRAGSRNETDDTLGLAHFLEHMAFNGSENVPEGEMVKSLERLGLSFGADTNASTTFTRTEYTLNLPDTGDETVDYALFLMREIADRLLIEEEAVERERGVVESEEARGNTPARKAGRAYTDFIYPDTLSRIRPVIGTPDTLAAMSADNLRAFYDTHYRPERSVLVMVGDFDVATMEAKIKEVFSDWENPTTPPADPDNGSVSKRAPDAKVYHDDELTTQAVLFDAFPSTYKMDSAERRRDNFIRGYANSIVNQRIRKRLLEADAPVLSAGIGYSSRRLGDQASASFSAKNDDWKAGLALLDEEIRRALQYGFQQAEYDEILANQRRSLTDFVNYAPKRRSGSLASGIIGSFAGSGITTKPEDSLERFETHARDIALSDLEAAFHTMWADFDPLIWLEGPQTEGLEPDEVLTTHHNFRHRKVTPPDARESLEFAYQNFGPHGKVVWENHIEDFDIHQLRFANNVRLNMKKTDFEENWIHVSVTIGEGWNVFPTNKPGLSYLASQLTLGGYEAHKASELAQIFAGKSIGLSFNVGSERLVMTGSTNPDDLEDQFKAWAGLLTAPGYRPEWLEKFRESIEASFHTIDSTPQGVASRDLGRIWANGDIRYGLQSKETYQSYTLADVRTVLQPLMDQGAIEIGVVGDFDLETVTQIVAKTFGALPKRRENFALNPAAFAKTFPKADRVTLTHTGADNQGAIYMAWPMSDDWSIERSRYLGMIRRIFQNRMTDVIREDEGLAYSPSAGLEFGKLSAPYGYFSASMLSDPKDFAGFEVAAKTIVADLRSGDITQDELDRALKPVLEGFERRDKENGSWLGNVTRSQSDPLGLDYRRSRDTAYTGLTIEQLNSVAKTVFDPEGLHIVKIVPESTLDK